MIICQTEQEQRVWDAAFGAAFAVGLTREPKRLGAEAKADTAVEELRALTQQRLRTLALPVVVPPPALDPPFPGPGIAGVDHGPPGWPGRS
jgi:hypothetical protein